MPTDYVMKVSSNGQVSIPARARARWNTNQVIVVDLGDRVVLRPLPAGSRRRAEREIWRARAKYWPGATSSQAGGCGPRRSQVIVFDSYAVLALLKGEPAADRVEQLLVGQDTVALTALGVSEVLEHLVRLTNEDEEEAALDLAQLGLATPFAIDIGVAQKPAYSGLVTITARRVR